ncbi:MAG: hydroxyethylthiazole kinase [Terrisporobacter sp.]|uniref:hydroxyethylthiazole kinase n=1 Tax=Terrisporobacter sp. TaxID=1965305 RepID=UPI002FCC6413
MFELIRKVKEINPLVLHYTNNVTITDCANTTLAIGASPLMSFSYEEVEDIVKIASAVVINIGTMNSDQIDLYVLAGKAANKYNKPVILDPVGVFATKARTDLTNKLLNEVKFDVVRGNISEIQFLGGLDVKGKGVDSFDDGSDASFVVREVAKKLECVVVASGKTDIVSDGEKNYKIYNGTSKLKFITGTGCMSTSLIGSFLPCSDKKIEAAVMGTLAMSLSGELADKNNQPIGTFKTNLFDYMFNLDEETINKYAKVEEIQLNYAL